MYSLMQKLVRSWHDNIKQMASSRLQSMIGASMLAYKRIAQGIIQWPFALWISFDLALCALSTFVPKPSIALLIYLGTLSHALICYVLLARPTIGAKNLAYIYNFALHTLTIVIIMTSVGLMVYREPCALALPIIIWFMLFLIDTRTVTAAHCINALKRALLMSLYNGPWTILLSATTLVFRFALEKPLVHLTLMALYLPALVACCSTLYTMWIHEQWEQLYAE